uniref:Uncharacterized protein n=1 Tax=Kalanchoe fedtschenkoi TaxID=63787 RepID=A0A7N0RFF0_KALFE
MEHFIIGCQQRRVKSQRSGGVWVTNQPGLGKELRYISSYLGTASRNAMRPDSAADPLLSPFLFHAPQSRSINLQEAEQFEISSNSTRITRRSVNESQRQDEEKKMRGLCLGRIWSCQQSFEAW